MSAERDLVMALFITIIIVLFTNLLRKYAGKAYLSVGTYVQLVDPDKSTQYVFPLLIDYIQLSF